MLNISNDFNIAVLWQVFGFARVGCYNLLPLYAQDAGKDKTIGCSKGRWS